ncbi:MAG: TetR/AcrR family transcriptional regulator [Pseudomonadota bacterium]
MAKQQFADRTYHHGALHDTLIQSAWEMIDLHGVESFTIVDAAQQAGVSKAAPYRHFRDRDALIDAVVDSGFEKLGAMVQEAVQSYETGSREKIITGGLTYIRFFHQHPAFFDLMFRGASDEDTSTDHSTRPQCLQMHIDAVSAWCYRAGVPEDMVVDTAIKMWATVHGIVSLSLNSTLRRACVETDIEELLRSFSDTFLDGIEASCQLLE